MNSPTTWSWSASVAGTLPNSKDAKGVGSLIGDLTFLFLFFISDTEEDE